MHGKSSYLMVALLLGSLLGAGCATKRYVRAQVDPVNTRVDQVSQQAQKQAAKQAADLKDTNAQLQQTQTKLDATTEVANSADSRSNDALKRTGLNQTQIASLHNVISNLEDYKVNNQAVVLFGFNKDALTPDAKTKLDALAQQTAGLSRYFITVEGFTDQTGPASYNEALSRRRANHVIEYLVAQHNIPVYRIHMIGLGENKLVDEGRTREARAQSRRVQITVFSATPLPAATPNTN
jgi:outer membrane protein OmpA-like peptidoglycan-associated protein